MSRTPLHPRTRAMALLLASSASLAACGGGSGEPAEANTATPAAAAPAPSAAPTEPTPQVRAAVDSVLTRVQSLQSTWRADKGVYAQDLQNLQDLALEVPEPRAIQPFVFNPDVDGDGTTYCLAAPSERRCVNLGTGELTTP